MEAGVGVSRGHLLAPVSIWAGRDKKAQRKVFCDQPGDMLGGVHQSRAAMEPFTFLMA